MSNVIINNSNLTNIANAIRNKNGSTNTYKPSEMANAINNISISEDLSTELTTQSNLLSNQGTTIDDIKLALQNKSAGGGEEIVLQEKTITPSTSQQNVIADTGYNGLSKVVVSAVDSSIDLDIKACNIKKDVSILGVTGNLEEGLTPTGTKEITANGTYDVTNYASALVNVPTSSGGSSIKMAQGTFTLDADATSYTLTGLEFRPKLFIVKGEIGVEGVARTAYWVKNEFTGESITCCHKSTNASITTVTSANYSSFGDDGFTIKQYLTNPLVAGTYDYIAFTDE